MQVRLSTIAILVFDMTVANAQGLEPLVHEGIISAPIETVWEAWTTDAGLQSWLAPHAEIDLRISGKMRTNYSPDGSLDDPSSIENTVLSYDPYRMISIRVSKAPEGFPFPNAIYDMWTVMYFEEVDGGQTRVKVVAAGFSEDEESQAMRSFFDQGNALTIQQMQERIPAAVQ
jgi:uncharacterized protein YndB with AHSA1/START domain